MAELSAEEFQFWVLDHEEQTFTVVRQNGDKTTVPVPVQSLIPGSEIRYTFFDWEKWWIGSVTRRGHVIYSMGYNPTKPDPGPHRPTLYLDQNKWSLVAAAVLQPERVRDKRERDAALEVVRLARDDGLILPLSSAHLLETTYLHTELRYEVGVTIASLSGGWEMRHPISVLEQEAHEALARRLGLPRLLGTGRPVITTEPNAWMRNEAVRGLSPAPCAGLEFFQQMLTAPGVLVQLLVDPESMPRKGDVTGWVEKHAGITEAFTNLRGDPNHRRSVARRRYFVENSNYYHMAVRGTRYQHDFPGFSDKELSALLSEGAMTSLVSEVFVQRFIDRLNKWVSNDLNDIFFLSCGAAYCDYTVAEKKTGTQLRQIQRSQGKVPRVFTTLHSAVEAMKADGVQTATELAGSS